MRTLPRLLVLARTSARFVLLLGLVILLASCERTLAPPDYGYTYYPILDSVQRIYRVYDSVYVTTGWQVQRYQQKDFTSGMTTDLNNRPLSILDTYRAPDAGGVFTFNERWTQFQDRDFAERTEGNTRFLTLNFPLRRGRTWNVNAQNNFGAIDAVIVSIDTTMRVGTFTFPRCTYVLHRQQKTLLFDIYTYEVYAYGIGLVERYDRYIEKIYNSATNQFDISTTSRVYRQVLLSHNYPTNP
jgi:hypothetical protein